MKKNLVALAVTSLAYLFALKAQADTSYLLIQGPFGPGGTTETFKWAENYTPGAANTVTNGFDLLSNALTSDELQYTAYSFGNFVNGFTLSGSAVANSFDDNTNSGLEWNYYTAGPTDGQWTYSANAGPSSSPVSDGSFDGWVYGTLVYDSNYNVTTVASIDGSDNAPTSADFSGATIVSVPEPSSVGLVLLGAAGAVAVSRRKRA